MLAVFEALTCASTDSHVSALSEFASAFARAGRLPSLRDLIKWAARVCALTTVSAATATNFITEKVCCVRVCVR
jgi:hypothetical protein